MVLVTLVIFHLKFPAVTLSPILYILIVAVSVWANGKGGYQFKGTARVESSGNFFDEGVQWVKSRAPKLIPKAAIIVKVDEIYITTGGPDAGKRVD